MTRFWVTAKCGDWCEVVVKDNDDNEIYRNMDYVPSYIPNWCGDYLDLEIDAETGTILNWDSNEVKAFLKSI